MNRLKKLDLTMLLTLTIVVFIGFRGGFDWLVIAGIVVPISVIILKFIVNDECPTPQPLSEDND
ncbi:MAG: hypothetical protein FWC97_08210 [Treponema sp.]|nr:hypothetical protein [Treponema sp.]